MLLLFDIGGTKTRIAVVREKNRNKIHSNDLQIFPTLAQYEEGIKEIKTRTEMLVDLDLIKAVIVGVGGPIDKEKGIMIHASGKKNLKDWIGKPLQKDLEKILNAEVVLENDAALGALGEANFGAGKDFSIVVYLTISTGVGGARVVRGRLDENSLGFEPGKQIIDADGSIFPQLDPPVTLESIISGQAIEKRMELLPSEIKNKDFWQEIAYYLALGLNDTIVHWSPEVIILGGAVSNDVPLKEVEKELKRVMRNFKNLPQIKKATLGDLSGLYGGLAYYNKL